MCLIRINAAVASQEVPGFESLPVDCMFSPSRLTFSTVPLSKNIPVRSVGLTKARGMRVYIYGCSPCLCLWVAL